MAKTGNSGNGGKTGAKAGAKSERKSATRPASGAGAQEPPRTTMYGPVTLLNIREHENLLVGPLTDYSHAAGLNAIIIAAAELPQAAIHYPIVFGHNNGVWSAFAVTGAQTNAFVDDKGAWTRDAYIPAMVRRYPFLLVGDREQGRLSLAADLAAPSLNVKQGHRLYEGGRASPTAERILRFCLSFDEQLHASAVLYQRIADAGIFVDQHAQVNLPDGTKTRIGRFFHRRRAQAGGPAGRGIPEAAQERRAQPGILPPVVDAQLEQHPSVGRASSRGRKRGGHRRWRQLNRVRAFP